MASRKPTTGDNYDGTAVAGPGVRRPRRMAFTVAELAGILRLKEHTVLAFIRAGELAATNLAAPGARRPNWRIFRKAIRTFLRGRNSEPAKPTARRRRKAKVDCPVDPTTGRVRDGFRV